MLGTLAARIARRPRATLLVALLFAVLALALGGPVAGRMASAVGDPHAQDELATDELSRAAGVDPGADVTVLVDPGVPVTRGVGYDRVAIAVATLADVPGVGSVQAPTADNGLRSRDRTAALVIGHYRAGVDADHVSKAVVAAFAGQPGVELGGTEITALQLNDTIGSDLARAELLAFPLLLLIALWVFGSVVAALLPLLMGGFAIAGSLLGLSVVNGAYQLSSYVLNLVIGLGLGLAIDYSLFIISRYREEALRDGYGTSAVIRALRSAGRTVAFSSLTVAAALASLLVFPQRFLFSMGVGGALVVAFAALSALVVLPALLVVLGARIERFSPAWHRRRRSEAAADPRRTIWYRAARTVMRRPVPALLAVLAIVAVLVFPVASVRFADVDASSLPASTSAARVQAAIDADFPGGDASQLQVAVRTDDPAAALLLRDRLAALPGARRVAAPSLLGNDTWMIGLSTDAGPYAASSQRLVRAILGSPPVPELAPAPHASAAGPQVRVAGDAASFVDLKRSMLAHLPLALGLVALIVLLVVFAFTQSVVLALKTLVVNALNAVAVLGVLVWVFQRGNLEWLLDFHSIGAIDLTQPVLVLVIAFGLSTDYGVFLLSRIKEEHDRGADDVTAVSVGLGQTGRIITSAAVLLCVAIGAFSTSGVLFIKEIGVGAVAAVILDVTLMRSVVVPAAMRLFGAANWWSPLDDSRGK